MLIHTTHFKTDVAEKDSGTWRYLMRFVFVHRIKLGLFIAFLIFFPFSLSANDKKENYLFLGNLNIPPMVYLKDSKPVGVVVDLAHALAARSRINIEIQAMDWTEAQSKVLSGEADALLQINQNKEREELYDFSEKLVKSNFCIFRKNNRIDIQNINSLFGSSVGVEEKGYPKLLLQKYPQIKIIIIDSWKRGFELVNAGEIDAVIVDRWVGEYELIVNHTKGITVIDKPVESNYSAIAVKKGNRQLLAKINEGLEKIREDGSMEKILKKWSKTETVYLTREQFNYLLFSIAVAILALLLLLIILLYIRKIRRINKNLNIAHIELQKKKQELEVALSKVKLLSGFIPICASCKKIRDDKGYWNQIESYITEHSMAEFSHGICPECVKKLYPEFYNNN